MTPDIDACGACLRRADLIAALAGYIDNEWRLRRGRPRLLALADDELLRWAGELEAWRRYERFSAELAVDRLVAAGVGAVCICSKAYPARLRELPDPPAVLHMLGFAAAVARTDAVAIVGARQASAYGHEMARALGRGLATAGVAVVSGMAMGVDAAAHSGALDRGGSTIAVLGCGADRPYPARFRTLHQQIARAGCVVSELPPGTPPRRWTFPARNRIIAALATGTVVVEGGERSGSLITADFAAELGRFVAAVPGAATSRLAAGPHLLLKAGAELVRDARDVVELLYGAGEREAGDGAVRVVIGAGPRPVRTADTGRAEAPPDLEPRLSALLKAVEEGHGTFAELATTPEAAATLALDLGTLELRGLIRRVFGGRYVRAAA
jgi:DNA processing protein